LTPKGTANVSGDLSVKKRTLIVFAIFFSASVFIFNSFYKESKSIVIANLNEEQIIHAKQAARGIEGFFETWTRSLTYLSNIDPIIDIDIAGKRYLELFYEANQDEIKAITRLDERGVIIYNFPSTSSLGLDISDQKHVRQLLQAHKPVISDVFKSVEGFDSIALHVPIFRGGVFKGSIGVLIDFESLTKRYLDVIKIGKTGYAWVVSRDGTQLYSPVPGYTGKSVFENAKDFPSVIVMVNDMLKGHAGVTSYIFDKIGTRNVEKTRKYAVYMPVKVGDTFWSIVVATAEQDVLAGLVSIRNKLVVVMGVFFIFGMVFSTLAAKAWFIVKEVEGRRKAEERYQQLFEDASDGIILLDERGTIVAANGSFVKMHGYTRKEISNMSLKDLGTPETFKLLAERIKRVLPGETLKFEAEQYHKDGHIVPFEVVLDLMRDDHGKRIVAFYRDVTERKQAENDKARLRLELAHLARVMTMNELSGSLAHEINQPLGAILNNASAAKLLLSQVKDKPGDLNEIIEDIINDTKRAGDVVRKIRGMVKKGEMEFEQVQMNALIEEVVALFRNAMSIDKVSLNLELTSDLAKVRGDRVHLQQVLLNLITNALEAMKGMPTKILTIRSELRAPDMVIVSVSDSGPGIKAAIKDIVFKPFFTTKKDGLGFGLAICRSIIEEHGGKIWIENNPDKGAKVAFSLKA
jgi:two-component system cell cycle sensor histidine kinase/response regulator CckA